MKKIWYASLAILISAGFLLARVVDVSSSNRLDCFLQKHDLALVYFYSHCRPSCSRSDQRAEYEQCRCALRQVGRMARYKDAGVGFVQANVGKCGLDDFVEDYNIASTPLFMLFSAGEPLVDDGGNPWVLSGCVHRKDLKNFIENSAGDLVERMLKERAEEKQRRLDEQLYWYYYYGYPYYGYCGPCSFGPNFYGSVGFWF